MQFMCLSGTFMCCLWAFSWPLWTCLEIILKYFFGNSPAISMLCFFQIPISRTPYQKPKPSENNKQKKNTFFRSAIFHLNGNHGNSFAVVCPQLQNVLQWMPHRNERNSSMTSRAGTRILHIMTLLKIAVSFFIVLFELFVGLGMFYGFGDNWVGFIYYNGKNIVTRLNQLIVWVNY